MIHVTCKYEMIGHSSYTVTPHPESHGDYTTVAIEFLHFNVGDVTVTHTILISDDEDCENVPNEHFISKIAPVCGMQPVNVIQPHAQVIINDSVEPECSK